MVAWIDGTGLFKLTRDRGSGFGKFKLWVLILKNGRREDMALYTEN